MRGKKFYRSEKDKVFAGIIGGLGEYFELDPVVLRSLAIIVLMASGFFPFGLVYLIGYLVFPKEPAYG